MAVAVQAPTRSIHSLARATLESDIQTGRATSALVSSTSSALSSSSSSSSSSSLSEQARPLYAHAQQPSPKRQRYTHQDDSIWAETLPNHVHTPQSLAEDDLEDILAMPVAVELKSRRSHASLMHSSSNQRSPASSAPPLSPLFHTGASAWTAHSNLSAPFPGSSSNTSAATSQTATNRSIQSHTSRARSRSQSRLARPIDLVAPPMPLRSAPPPGSGTETTGEPETQTEWETLQVAEPNARIPCATEPSSGSVSEIRSDAPAITFPSVKAATARQSPTLSSDITSGTSKNLPPRTRVNTNAHPRSVPSPSTNSISPPVSGVPRKPKASPSSSLNSRNRTRSTAPRPQKTSPYLDDTDAFPDATPPWMAAPAPIVFRSGEDGSLRGQGRVDEMVLPAVARRLEAERLAAASSTATSLLITEWDAQGRPVRAGDVQAPLPPLPRHSSNDASLSSSGNGPTAEFEERGDALGAGDTGPEVALKPSSRTSSLPPPMPAPVPLASAPPSPVRRSERPSTPPHDLTVIDEEIESKKGLCGCTIS